MLSEIQLQIQLPNTAIFKTAQRALGEKLNPSVVVAPPMMIGMLMKYLKVLVRILKILPI